MEKRRKNGIKRKLRKEIQKERKQEGREERKQFNPEKCNPVCKPNDAKFGLAYACHGSSRK